MTTRQVLTRAIQAAVKGREPDVLRGLDIAWQDGKPHIRCPYPPHADENPSWRWDEQKARAFCTCITKSHSIFDVVMAIKGIDFEAAKVIVAQLLGRDDLVRHRHEAETGYEAADAERLLNAPAEHRDDDLPIKYLAHRLGVSLEEMPRPSTPTVGLKAHAYYDPPPSGSKPKPKLLGHFPCAAFGTVAADGRRHAHRIYLASGAAGKADLGIGPNGIPRQPKKSARITDGVSRAGCSVFWGDPERAPSLYLAEGIETGAAIALAFRDKIEVGQAAVAAAISATGLEKFRPYAATKQVIVCADRDEGVKANGQPGSRRGEQAARKFAMQHYQSVDISIALPGHKGESIDWLDVLRINDAPTLAMIILFARVQFVPTEAELADLSRQ